MQPDPNDAELTRTFHTPGSEVPPPATGNWGHLQIVEEIGRGGFGSVYRAWDPTLEREVALKLFHSVTKTADLHSEGRQLAKLRHANVVQVYGVAEHDGRAGLWMEFIHGRTLSRLVQEQGRLGAHEATAIAMEVCRAVAAVHASGLVHRDIKAQNVMREDGGRIVLMDFGLTGPRDATSNISGTPVCMAPEHLRGGPASVRTDIYALGVLLYFLVTGKYPYDASTITELVRQQQEGRMKLIADLRQDLPTGYINVVERALAARPEDRFETVGQFAQALVSADQTTSTASELALAAAVAAVQTASKPKRARWAVAAALCTVAALGIAGWLLRDKLVPSASGPHILSVAVMPFENLTNDPKDDYLGDGIGEEISNWLGKSKDLRVISRNSTQQFRGSKETVTAIGKKLRADWLIGGSLRKDGSRVKVRVEVVQASDGTQKLSDTHEYDLKDAFTVAEQIGGSLASLMNVRLDAHPAKLDPETRDLYWRAEEAGRQQSPVGLRTATDLMQKVTERAPNYDMAFVKLASYYGTLAAFMGGTNADIEKARSNAERVLRLNNRSAEAHGALGFIKSRFDWDWKGAEEEFRLAAAIDPNCEDALPNYANLLMYEGRLGEARAELNLLEAADPLSFRIPHTRSLIAIYEGDLREAERENAAALALMPRNPLRRALRGIIGSLSLRNEEAIQDLQQAKEMTGSRQYLGDLGWAYARAGQKKEAQQILARLEDDKTASPVDPAAILVGLGEAGQALDWLEKAYAARDPALIQLWMGPIWRPLRDQPRYRALVDKIFQGAPLKAPPK